jgi:hypothetical protein
VSGFSCLLVELHGDAVVHLYIGLACEFGGFLVAALVYEEPCEGCHDYYDAEYQRAGELAFIGLRFGEELVAFGGIFLRIYGISFHLCVIVI